LDNDYGIYTVCKTIAEVKEYVNMQLRVAQNTTRISLYIEA